MDEYKFVEPKTQASIRTIVIDADTIRELQDWKEVQEKVLPDNELVLTYSGVPTSKHTLPRALEKLASLAGVHRIKIHALRHSHASLLISMGENPLIIKDRLGHEEIQTTLGIYGHLYPNSNIEVAKKLSGLLTYTPATHSIADYTSNPPGTTQALVRVGLFVVFLIHFCVLLLMDYLYFLVCFLWFGIIRASHSTININLD